MNKNIVLLGNAGSGKGTISKWLLRDFPSHLLHLSTGDLLRQSASKNAAVAEKLKNGNLVDDKVLLPLLKGNIDNAILKTHRKFLFDGFPRTVIQAQFLDSILDPASILVFNIKVPKDILIMRLTDRWIHLPSGREYNLNFNPPKQPGIDDITGERLTKRSDDENISTVLHRLNTFEANINALLNYYSNRLETFHGNTSYEIYPQIKALIK